jgi:hypothetical protein
LDLIPGEYVRAGVVGGQIGHGDLLGLSPDAYRQLKENEGTAHDVGVNGRSATGAFRLPRVDGKEVN